MITKNAMDLLVRRESAQDEEFANAHAADDFDMIISPKDQKLVGVAMLHGVHVCWQCFEQFIDDPTSPLRSVEYNCGGYGTRILLHSKCVNKAAKRGKAIILMVELAHQVKRARTVLTKPFRRS